MNFKKHLNEYNYFEIISKLAYLNNFEVYIVGGYVRDLLLAREINEIDYLIIGDGPKFAELLAEEIECKEG